MIRWRKYHELPTATHLLAEGVKWITKTRGVVRVMANGPIDSNGRFTVSLWNTRTGKYFQKKMTKMQLTKAIKNDGIEVVWVDDSFKFGEMVKP